MPSTAQHLITRADQYRSPPRQITWLARRRPSWVFYAHIAKIIWSAARLAKRGRYTNRSWIESSLATVAALEAAGGRLRIENTETFKRLDQPCVFIGNHMSVLETFVLPCVIQPHRDVTFVVKQSLIDYPFFRHVMINRNPIVVGRSNPREDLKTVMAGGERCFAANVSVVIFPQTTRSDTFDPNKFNSIGIKLAKRNRVPVVPVAIKTDAWGVGQWLRDCGPIAPEKTVHICFGQPLTVTGNGKSQHLHVAAFIRHKLALWQGQ